MNIFRICVLAIIMATSAGCAALDQAIRDAALYPASMPSRVSYIVIPRNVRDITILYRVAGSTTQLANRSRINRYRHVILGDVSDQFLFWTPHPSYTIHGGYDVFHVRMEDVYGRSWYVNGNGM